jgi:RNA polymerase sigma-70 factor (ECF subfamily)
MPIVTTPTVTASLDRVRTAAGPSAPAEPTDDVLVAALRRRDENAYLELVRRHTPLMLRVARSVVGSTEAAEDVVQDTWLAVLRSVDRFEGRSTFKTWLMRILVNTARNRRMRESRTVCWSTLPGDAPAWDAVLAGRSAEPAGPLDHAIAGEVWEVIRAALACLPDRQRVVVVLRDVEGSSPEEVGAILGVSRGNQRVLLHRGRARLRELLAAADTDAVSA